MKIVILSEKPSITRIIAPVIAQKLAGHDVIVLHTMGIGAYQYRLPRGLKWSKYPFVEQPKMLIHRPGHQYMPYRLAPCQGSTRDGWVAAPEVEPISTLKAADKIVFACDPDHTGVMGFFITLAGALGEDAALEKRDAIVLRSFDEESIRRSFENMSTYPDDFQDTFLRYGQAKRYFDHNFNLNSLTIMGKTLSSSGIDSSQHVLSKYGLQALYFICRNPDLTEGTLIEKFRHWKGTGKYRNDSVMLGSSMSTVAIIEQLLDMGAIQRQDGASPSGRKIQLSPLGEGLISNLHPDCEDPDLPFRLNAWCEAGLDTSRPAMDRYLVRFFGKQKRLLDRPCRVQTPCKVQVE